MNNNAPYYYLSRIRGKCLLEWARIWLRTSNDVFFEIYGFNFNPHIYPGLYETVMKEQLNEINDTIARGIIPTLSLRMRR